MKEVIAVIRPGCLGATKKSLEDKGYNSMTIIPVEGRGKQGGLACPLADIDPEMVRAESKRGISLCTATKKLVPTDPKYALESDSKLTRPVAWLPKKLISVVVATDADVESVVSAIIESNRTGNIGDGKIFIVPIEETYHIRTGKIGEEAV